MDNYELCEKLVAKTGVSYALAKSALERSDWDMLDAMILLEQEGTINTPESGSYCGGDACSSDSNQASFTDGNKSGRYSCGKTYTDCCGERDARREDHARRRAERREQCRGIFGKLWDFLIKNRMTAYNNCGKETIDIPVWVVLLIFFGTGVWLPIIAILISLAYGWQYHFVGPELGAENVNRVAQATGQAVYRASQDIKDSFADMKANSQSGDNNRDGESCN